MEASLIDAALDCDTKYIIKLFKKEISDIDFKCISVPRNIFTDYNKLYILIIDKLKYLGYGNDLLEMMPIIDDYLEFLC